MAHDPEEAADGLTSDEARECWDLDGAEAEQAERAAQNGCRRCVDCEDQQHHWLQPDHDPETDRAFVPCKHCDAEAQLCEECFAVAVWPIVSDSPVCDDCRAGLGDFEP